MKIGCPQCGETKEAYPPDNEHIIYKLKPCSRLDSMPIPYHCDDCHHEWKAYWDKKHIHGRTF